MDIKQDDYSSVELAGGDEFSPDERRILSFISECDHVQGASIQDIVAGTGLAEQKVR